MTSQRLLKFLFLVSFGATMTALWLWRSTGEPPSPWLIRGAIAAFGAGFVVFVVSDVTRPRLMLRFLASLFALIAVIAFAADFSHAGTNGGFNATSLMSHWNDFAPSMLASAKTAVLRSPVSLVWDPVLTTLLASPTFVIFAALAFWSGIASRPRREIRIFVN